MLTFVLKIELNLTLQYICISNYFKAFNTILERKPLFGGFFLLKYKIMFSDPIKILP